VVEAGTCLHKNLLAAYGDSHANRVFISSMYVCGVFLSSHEYFLQMHAACC